MMFAVRCIDRSDQPGVRAATRPSHLEYLKSLGSAVVLVGPLLAPDGETPIGSLLLFEAADLATVERLAADDPYARAGLFQTVEITPFRISIDNRHA